MNENDKTPVWGRFPEINPGKKRLAIMPLAVLLPPLGDLSQLSGFRQEIQARLDEVQNAQGAGSEEGVTTRLGEEAMLLQVLQWLNLGESR